MIIIVKNIGFLCMVSISMFFFACDGNKTPTDTKTASSALQHNTPKSAANKPIKSKSTATSSEVTPPDGTMLATYTAALPGSGKLRAQIQTSMGTITCSLFADKAPITVENFIGLALGKKDWIHPRTKQRQTGVPLYDNVVFHRVMPGFMIQTGDPLGVGYGGPGYRFGDEVSADVRFDKPGRLAMANIGPGTNGSQIFITEAPTPHLNGKHTIFGQCDSMNIVKKISGVEKQGRSSKPKQPIIIQSVVIDKKG